MASGSLLVLGGSWFLGRAVVAEALARGWSVTTFRRGVTGADVPGVEVIRGDRTSAADLERLAKSGPWDLVVDTSGYVPREQGRAERRTAMTWRHIARELGRLHAITLTGPAGTVVQTTEPTTTQVGILRACGLTPPPRITTLDPS